MLKCVCAYVCAYVCVHTCVLIRDEATTAHRKWGENVRKGGMKSNKPWEPGEVVSHTHTYRYTLA